MKLSELHSGIISEKKYRKSNKRKIAMQAALRRNDKSQEDLADELGVDPSTVSRLKSGVRDPSIDLLRQMASSGIDVASVFDIKSGGADEGNKIGKGLRSHADISKVSDKMREASQAAQADTNEPKH